MPRSTSLTKNIDSLAIPPVAEAKFERGFKSWTENIAAALRSNFGLARVAPLAPRALAEHLGAVILEPKDIPDIPQDTLLYLTSSTGDEWSAVTVRASGADIIVLNPTHSPARTSSDLMHELAHLLRRHEPSQVIISADTGVGLRSFNPLQEAEANWLAGTLLLPRDALAYCVAKGLPRNEIAQQYTVSEELVRYRLNVTGVGKQFRA